MRLAVGGEALVAGPAGRFAADGGQGRHVEQVARLGPPAADAAPAAVLPGIAVEGGDTEQGGGLAAAEAAEFGHLGAEAGGIDGSAAGDRLDDGVTAAEFGVGGNACAHTAVAVLNVGLEGFERGGGAASGLGAEFGAELAQGTELLDEFAAEGEQVAEVLEVGWKPTRLICCTAARANASSSAVRDGVAARPASEECQASRCRYCWRSPAVATTGAVLQRTTGAALESALRPVLASDAVLVSDAGTAYPGCARALGL